jgi:hypothetical protein
MDRIQEINPPPSPSPPCPSAVSCRNQFSRPGGSDHHTPPTPFFLIKNLIFAFLFFFFFFSSKKIRKAYPIKESGGHLQYSKLLSFTANGAFLLRNARCKSHRLGCISKKSGLYFFPVLAQFYSFLEEGSKI